MIYGDVKFAIGGKVSVVEECANEPISVCREYVIQHRRDPRYVGGILLVNSRRNRNSES
jgi:hypothetical protein